MVKQEGEKFLNIREIADRNSISGSTVRRLIKRKKLTAKLNYRGEYVVNEKEVTEFFKFKPLYKEASAS